MNRFKKELKKQGFRLEDHFLSLPTDCGIQSIRVNAEQATYTIYHNSFITRFTFDRYMVYKRDDLQ